MKIFRLYIYIYIHIEKEQQKTYHKKFPRQVAAIVNSTVHGYELFHARFILDARIVQGRVQHNDSETEHVTSVRIRKYIGIQLAVPLCEAFHHPINLLCFAGQSERPKKLSKSLHENQIGEIMQFDECPQHPLVEVVSFTKVIADRRFVKTFALVEELGDVLGRRRQQIVLDQVLDALLRVHVELLTADRRLLSLIRWLGLIGGKTTALHRLHFSHHFTQLIFQLLQQKRTGQQNCMKMASTICSIFRIGELSLILRSSRIERSN